MTIKFRDWANESASSIKSHTLRIINVESGCRDVFEHKLTTILKEHYDFPQHIANVLNNTGKPGLAKLLKTKFPTKPELRLGELGEIIATEYIEERTNFHTPVKRLRYKDHQNMAMRGTDVIGFDISINDQISFLKVEVKSRKDLNSSPVSDARKTLKRARARPSPHSLNFIASILVSTNMKLSKAINIAALKDGIDISQVSHMIFTFSENSPKQYLENDLRKYSGKVPQISVGLIVTSLLKFVRNVYKKGVSK